MKRKIQPINSWLRLGLNVLFAFAVADSRRFMPSTTFIIATYVIGLIGTAVAWSWDFRWNQEISMAGYLAIVYSITILVLSGQFLLALGAFALLIAAIVYPTVLKYIRQQIRNGRL